MDSFSVLLIRLMITITIKGKGVQPPQLNSLVWDDHPDLTIQHCAEHYHNIILSFLNGRFFVSLSALFMCPRKIR